MSRSSVRRSVIRVVVVDDQALVRQEIRELLARTRDIEVVGEASDGKDAVDLVQRTHPDVGLFDLRMPGWSGLDAVRGLRRRKIVLKTILLTTRDDGGAPEVTIQGSVAGCLSKDVSLEELAAAIRDVAAGRILAQTTAAVGAGKSDPLTARELEIIRLIARGLSNREIAAMLGTAEGTVKNQASSILQKLGVPNRTRAVLRAAELGLL